MKLLSYLIVLLLGTYIGKYYIGIAKLYSWIAILENFGAPSPTTSKAIIYTLSIPEWAFMIFVLFRIYVCLKSKKIVIPSSYIGLSYKVGLTITLLSLLAFLITVLGSIGLPVGGMSGVPFAMVLFPMGVISMILMLFIEVPEIKRWFKKPPNTYEPSTSQ